ncbi:MAG TPA: enoyl-CoA hydratase-related protein [Mycobacteriales bacterium]|nr:enoyl-CoA hydratase-related protein [Mycobacteriales bacterium]
MSTELLTERDGHVLRLTINREEKRNALSADVMRGLFDGVTAASKDDDVRVVVVASAGDRVFCSGADLAVMGNDATGLERHVGRGMLAKLVVAMRSCPVPIVARVQGLCLAGGIGLAAGTDVVLARESAAFGMPEVDRGLWPFMVSALLARHVSPKHAMDRMLIGDRFDAKTAYEMGLVSRVFPDETFDADFDGYIAKLAAAAPVAVRLGKAAWVSAVETTSLPAALEAMQAQLSLLTTTKDAVEGISAFFEKRPPEWTGR